MPRVLAFDYGLKRTGVAVSDPLQLIANSLQTVPTQQIFDFIKSYCAREEVEAFVVGYPFSHGQAENPVAGNIDQFIVKLQALYRDKKINKVDESFTSKIASQTLSMSGVSRKERHKKGNIDAISANIILQTYLEMKYLNE